MSDGMQDTAREELEMNANSEEAEEKGIKWTVRGWSSIERGLLRERRGLRDCLQLREFLKLGRIDRGREIAESGSVG